MTSTEKTQKTPAHEIYQKIYSDLKLNPRTVQWYATEGYIPKPERIGGEAFYSPSAQIETRVRVINTLQKRFDLKLKEIREIVGQQAESDWEMIQNLFAALEDLFPYFAVDWQGNEYVSKKGEQMAKIIVHKLKVQPVHEIRIEAAEEEFERTLKEDPEQTFGGGDDF